MLTQLGNEKIFRGPRLGENMIAWNDLQLAGVKTVLNLERGWFELFHGELNQEVRLSAIHGMTNVHLQLGDLKRPSSADLFSALVIIKDALTRGGVYFHCLHGVDRTGLVAAMVRVHRQGWSAEEAIREMYRMGFHKFPYEALGWVKRLEECLG